jgi:hypothetical protein
MSFMEPAEFQRAGVVDVPNAIVDFFQANILPDGLEMLRISPPPALT